MDAGLHVLCEKLMARDIAPCKEMIKHAKDKGVLLSIGHQRHYSMLYAHALEVVKPASSATSSTSGPCGTATTPGRYTADSDVETAKKYRRGVRHARTTRRLVQGSSARGRRRAAAREARELAFGNPEVRLQGRRGTGPLAAASTTTGGGLMAELGSHQLDASSIFLGHVHPLAVQGVGGKFFYGPGRNDRESDDGVFVTFEFPGTNHPKAQQGRQGRRTTSSSSPTRRSTPTSFEELRRVPHGQPRAR